MSKGGHVSRGLQTGKAFIISLIGFGILLAAIGLLLRYTPLPERWVHLYVMAALLIMCFFIGLLSGTIMGKRGILFGALSAAALLLLIVIISVMITGIYSESGLLRLKFLPCIIFGGLGGMIGVNLRSG